MSHVSHHQHPPSIQHVGLHVNALWPWNIIVTIAYSQNPIICAQDSLPILRVPNYCRVWARAWKNVLLSNSGPHFVTRAQSSSGWPRDWQSLLNGSVIWGPHPSNHKHSNPVKGLGRDETLYYSYQLFCSPHQSKLSLPHHNETKFPLAL